MKINEMILEVTRRCNQNCRHCLRGTSENLDADKALFENIFDEIEEIDTIIFTGGEPSLNIKYMYDVLDYCKKACIKIRSIYTVTNGLANQEQLVQVMEAWLDYCITATDSPNREEFLRKYFFRISCSVDEFHKEIDPVWYSFFTRTGYYDDSKEVSYHDYQSLIESGNVILNKLDESEEYVTGISGEDILKFTLKNGVYDVVYVSTNGHIYSGCNFSYEDYDEYKLTNNDLYLYTLEDICKMHM